MSRKDVMVLDRFNAQLRERFRACTTADEVIRVATDAGLSLDDGELVAIALAIGPDDPSNPSSPEDLDTMLSSSYAQSMTTEGRPYEEVFDELEERLASPQSYESVTHQACHAAEGSRVDETA